jgi:hypothetical protein
MKAAGIRAQQAVAAMADPTQLVVQVKEEPEL